MVRVFFVLLFFVVQCTKYVESVPSDSSESDFFQESDNSFDKIEDVFDSQKKDEDSNFIPDQDDEQKEVVETEETENIYDKRFSFVTNTQYLTVLKDIILKSKKSINIATLEFNADDNTVNMVKTMLVNAHSLGKEIKIILENDVKDNPQAVTFFQNFGIDAKLDADHITSHLKLVIIDDKYTLLGSTNFSFKSLKYNNEANLLINDENITGFYKKYFNKLYADSSKKIDVGSYGDDAFRSLTDGEFAKIIESQLKSAKNRVYIVMYAANYNTSVVKGITNSIIDAKESGADVKVILEQSDFDQNINSLNSYFANKLKSNGIFVCFDSMEVITHAKFLIIDNSVIVMSANFSESGLLKNHEVGALCKNPEVLNQALSYFNKLYQEYCQ